MEANILNPKVDFFFNKAKKWKEEFEHLRTIVFNCGLTEELKWGCPCYTFQGRNIVLMHGFKEYCALLFFKGILLKDTRSILIQQTENVQAARQIRFTALREIVKLETTLKAYVKEAIKLEEDDKKVVLKKTAQFTMPQELKDKLNDTPDLKAAFNALTPGRQRAYMLHFSAPKQAKPVKQE